VICRYNQTYPDQWPDRTDFAFPTKRAVLKIVASIFLTRLKQLIKAPIWIFLGKSKFQTFYAKALKNGQKKAGPFGSG
jgi:hypothetical protein